MKPIPSRTIASVAVIAVLNIVLMTFSPVADFCCVALPKIRIYRDEAPPREGHEPTP
jgi:hypothetical protein